MPSFDISGNPVCHIGRGHCQPMWPRSYGVLSDVARQSCGTLDMEAMQHVVAQKGTHEWDLRRKHRSVSGTMSRGDIAPGSCGKLRMRLADCWAVAASTDAFLDYRYLAAAGWLWRCQALRSVRVSDALRGAICQDTHIG